MHKKIIAAILLLITLILYKSRKKYFVLGYIFLRRSVQNVTKMFNSKKNETLKPSYEKKIKEKDSDDESDEEGLPP